MSDEAARVAGEIEGLLGTRQRISEWLHRLGQSGQDVPAAVRDRVRSDYQGRLGKVVDELRGHSAAISENLASLRRELADRERVRAAEEEALAEAQLRHAVGEYAEEEWRAHEERSGTRLEVLGGEIHRISAEIARLEDVLAQIAGAPVPAPAPVVEVEVEPVSDPAAAPAEFQVIHEEPTAGPFGIGSETFITLEDGPSNPATQSVFDAPPALPTDPDPAMELPAEPVMPEAPRFTPKSGTIPPRPRPSGSHKPAGDELAFLKSVTVDSHKPGRANGIDTKSASSAASAAAVATKTLKCQDCGTLNRPTEWYCERCGAELSAV